MSNRPIQTILQSFDQVAVEFNIRCIYIYIFYPCIYQSPFHYANMHSAAFFASLGLAGLVAGAPSAPHNIKARQASGAQNVVYWGGTNNESDDLSTYCTATAGIDILVLSFLDIYGSTGSIPAGNIGNSCYVGTNGAPQLCDNLAASIASCQAAGIKIILSLGGAAGSYSLQSQSQAVAIGQYLWEAYGNSGSSSVQRPFGNVFVNGFDFDLELNAGSQYYQYLISTLRSNFASDPKNTYYITGAPQCPLPLSLLNFNVDRRPMAC